jgi:hypothetical protein
MTNIKKRKAFISFYLLVLVLVIMISIGASMYLLTRGEQKILKNITRSNQAYYAAEAGIEDILLRLVKSLNWSTSYSFNVGDTTTTIEVADIIGGSRIITSKGNDAGRTRKIQIVHRVSTEEVAFHYGAQIGDGGMEMGNNAMVKGNVFSNGSVTSIQKGNIQNTIKVATIGSRIEGLIVGEDAYTHNCKNCTIGGTLYFSGGGSENCSSTEGIKEHPVQESQDLPIPQSQIDEWKNEAEKAGIISGDYVLDGKVIDFLGPKKITGNMLLDNKATLVMTGTIWVVGNIEVKNGAGIRLDPNSYGELSGVLIDDGTISVRPGVGLEGSGEEGSYLLLLSTSASLDKAVPAISIDNTTVGGIFYTPNIYDERNGGVIVIRNNVSARQVTGYKIYLEENAIINYEYGLQDAEFSSGPGGSWEVASWKEIE